MTALAQLFHSFFVNSKTLKIKTMKKQALFLLFIAFLGNYTVAQTADEILNQYYENSGGMDNWKLLKGLKMYASVNQMGMEIPIEIVRLKSGKTMTKVTFQGKEIKQGVFNGEVLWGDNFMTQEAEKSDQEVTENMKRTATDFPDALFNYKSKGYTLERLKDEDYEGTKCFKLKMTKKTVLVDGKEEDNVEFYFFDKDNFVPISQQAEIKSGPMKGQMSDSKLSDYQEVDGLYFPFSLTQGLVGGESQGIIISKIELNPVIDESEFEFPAETKPEE